MKTGDMPKTPTVLCAVRVASYVVCRLRDTKRIFLWGPGHALTITPSCHVVADGERQVGGRSERASETTCGRALVVVSHVYVYRAYYGQEYIGGYDRKGAKAL
jgi:hypothetical protein